MKKAQEQKHSIKEWAIDDRPREKLLSKSPNSLSDSELLAILITSGRKDKSAVDLGKEILTYGKNSLDTLSKCSPGELMKIKGIGVAKAVRIVAALELARRRQAGIPLESRSITKSSDIAEYLQAILKDHPYEVFGVVYLNRAHKINHFEIISKGGINSTVVDPRIILKKALEHNATSIILCHNHPSGSLKPSSADHLLTQKIIDASRLFDIKVLDHIIVSDEGHYSFANNNQL